MGRRPKNPSKTTTRRGTAPRKGSKDEIVERRQVVVRLRMQGLGYREIAKEIGIGHMTIKRDLEIISEETSKRMGKFERDYAIASTVSVYEQVEAEAWREFRAAGPGSAQRARFLDVVRAARNDQTKLLTDLGFLKKAPHEVQHTVTSKVVEQWSPQAQDLVALAIIKAGLSPADEPVREIIDAPVAVVKTPPRLPPRRGNGSNYETVIEVDSDLEE